MKFDTLLAIDCWWNLPDQIANRINDSKIKEKLFVNTTKIHDITQPMHKVFSNAKLQNDLSKFLADCKEFTKQNGRPKRILIAGQAWQSGIHNEAIGLLKLLPFMGMFEIYADPHYIALGTKEINRTCTNEHIGKDSLDWQSVDFYLWKLMPQRK